MSEYYSIDSLYRQSADWEIRYDNEHEVIYIDNYFENPQEVKQHIEDLLINTDWADFAQTKIRHREQWQHLDFVGQSEWTTRYLNLPAERFKLVPWR